MFSNDEMAEQLCQLYDVIILPLTLPECRSLTIAQIVHRSSARKRLLLMSDTNADRSVTLRVFDDHVRSDASTSQIIAAIRKMVDEEPKHLTESELEAGLQELRRKASVFQEMTCHSYHPHLSDTLPRELAQKMVLHLSDFHLGTITEAHSYRTQLITDLKGLGVRRLDYLILSGDIADRAQRDEYVAALDLVRGIIDRYEIEPQRLIIIPGNHDVNWDQAAEAYRYVPHHRVGPALSENQVSLDEKGVLQRDDALYTARFNAFSEMFYQPLCGHAYPLEYAQQGILHPFPDDKMLFLTFNSAWQIDHLHKTRISIHMDSFARGLGATQSSAYDDWLKIAVWHHPLYGPEAIRHPEIMEQMVDNGFQVMLHGHIHEADRVFYDKVPGKDMHIIAAGTFGAPTAQRVPGIPYQYNVIEYDPTKQRLKVLTRRKDHMQGRWVADARWGNPPRPYYNITLRRR